MIRSKVIRFVHRDNLKYLPKNARITGNATPQQQWRKGMVSVELDFTWIKNNTGMYERLMGRR